MFQRNSKKEVNHKFLNFSFNFSLFRYLEAYEKIYFLGEEADEAPSESSRMGFSRVSRYQRNFFSFYYLQLYTAFFSLKNFYWCCFKYTVPINSYFYFQMYCIHIYNWFFLFWFRYEPTSTNNICWRYV